MQQGNTEKPGLKTVHSITLSVCSYMLPAQMTEPPQHAIRWAGEIMVRSWVNMHWPMARWTTQKVTHLTHWPHQPIACFGCITNINKEAVFSQRDRAMFYESLIYIIYM